MGNAIILGSAFSREVLGPHRLQAEKIPTRFGEATLHRVLGLDNAWVLARHGLPHRILPHQVPFRAHAAALQEVGVRALLVTSSVGVLDPTLPLHRPLLIRDLLMPENRLPTGEVCTLFSDSSPNQGHLVLEEGLFSKNLGMQLEEMANALGIALGPAAVFAYVPGPRTKTPAENAFWRQAGAQVNSMSVGPEVVLANELQIPTIALGVGHKYSTPGSRDRLDQETITTSLDRARAAMTDLVVAFLEKAKPVPFGNHLHVFDEPREE
jgi:5'-methylthioadenosine phosphorylase